MSPTLHAALPAAGPFASRVAFCREALAAGIESVLVEPGPEWPDPLVAALALARSVPHLQFLVAHRPGRMAPALFVQQVNTFSVLAGGRLRLLLAAEEGLPEGEGAARLTEYCEVCRRFWAGEGPVNFEGRYYRVAEGRLNTPFVPGGAPEIVLEGDVAEGKHRILRGVEAAPA